MAASVVGTDHTRAGLPCQDHARVRVVPHPDGARLVVAIADGAGSARQAEAGARLACDAALGVLEGDLTFEDTTLPARLVAAVRAAIEPVAAAAGAVMRDYSCTLLAVVVAPDWSLCAQIGDGGIVVAAPEGVDPPYAWVFWPEKGEYANETLFVTGADAAARFEIAWRRGALDEVALFTDGLERLALDFQARAAFTSFFAPMFGAMRALPPDDDVEVAAATRDLAAFLGSARVNERTSDDKTLVLATRREA